MSMQTEESIKDWTPEYKTEYCNWCWGHDYGNCTECALKPKKKEIPYGEILAEAKEVIDKLLAGEKKRSETLYTEEELGQAIQNEREACAKECENLDVDIFSMTSENYQCAEVIRDRSRK